MALKHCTYHNTHCKSVVRTLKCLQMTWCVSSVKHSDSLLQVPVTACNGQTDSGQPAVLNTEQASSIKITITSSLDQVDLQPLGSTAVMQQGYHCMLQQAGIMVDRAEGVRLMLSGMTPCLRPECLRRSCSRRVRTISGRRTGSGTRGCRN